LFWLVFIASYACKPPNICFQGTKYESNREDVVYLHSTLWRWARLWLELFASSSRISYLSSYVFLRRPCLYSEIALYVCLAAIWSSLCFWSSMYRFIPPLVVLTPHDSNVAVYQQVCWVLRVVYAIVRLSSGLVQARPSCCVPLTRIENEEPVLVSKI